MYSLDGHCPVSDMTFWILLIKAWLPALLLPLALLAMSTVITDGVGVDSLDGVNSDTIEF